MKRSRYLFLLAVEGEKKPYYVMIESFSKTLACVRMKRLCKKLGKGNSKFMLTNVFEKIEVL